MTERRQTVLQDFKAPVKLKISLLWAALMFCYVYGDFFGLFIPDRLAEMNKGVIGPLGQATPAVLVGVSVMMAIPSLMVFLSLALPPPASRWANVMFGGIYTGIMLLTMLPGAPPFYLFLGIVEVGLSLMILWYAWTWPRADSERAPVAQAH